MAVPDLRSNSHYMSKLPTSTQASGRSNFEELAWPCVPPTVVGEQNFTDQQRALYYRQPYSVAMNSLNPPVPLFPNHPAIHEPILPKFPPQMFEIPDIHDSNSVFNEGSFQANAGVARPVPPHHPSFEPSAAVPPPPVCRTLLPFPGDWRPPSYISAAAAAATGAGGGGGDGSTNSSPLVHSEENNGYDVPMSQPLTQQQNVFSSSTAKTPIKKAKSPKKRKRKDPNEPQKPVSAYSLFFRNAQSAIKTQNPNATFGDISKIVASMWDNLDNEIKRFYKRQMEVAKKEYLKQLAVYRANLSTQQESEGRSASSKEESEQSQQQTALTKVSSSSSSSSSSVSSSLLASHGDESASQGPSASEGQTQDHSSAVLHPRPPSVEASVHRLPISHQAMTQHQPPPPVYFKELVPGGLSPLRNGGVYGVPTNILPAMSQNMFQSYDTKRPDYFGPGIGISQNHYVDNRYAAAGMWNHSLQNDNYTPKCHNWTLWPK